MERHGLERTPCDKNIYFFKISKSKRARLQKFTGHERTRSPAPPPQQQQLITWRTTWNQRRRQNNDDEMDVTRSPARNTQPRDPTNIHIGILTQSESQSTGFSTIQMTVDGNAPELSSFTTESTAALFVQQSLDTYKASQINISSFISILIGIKAQGWALMGTNAFLNSSKQEVVKTFYFEKVSGRSLSRDTTTAAAVATTAAATAPSKQGPYTPVGSGAGPETLLSPTAAAAALTRDRQQSQEGKSSSAETVEQRIAAITAAQNARKSFLLQQQQNSESKLSPAPTSSAYRDGDDDDQPAPASGGDASASPLLFAVTPRLKSTTPGARPAGGGTGGGGGGPAAASTEIQKKNAEYFKRMKQEQDLEKKKQEEEESKLDEAEQRRRKEQRALQEAHDASKTAHFSRLGSTFVTGAGLFGGKKPAN